MLNVRGLTVEKCLAIESEYLAVHDELRFVCLTETWLNKDSIRACRFDGLELSSFYVRQHHIHGGVAVWGRADVNTTDLQLTPYCEELNFEICGCEVMPTKRQKLIILVCYRSPKGDIDIFVKKLEVVLELLYKPKTKFILMGDFNIDPNRDRINFTKLNSVLQTFNLVNNLYNEPTRVAGGSSSCIDLVFCDGHSPPDSYAILENDISDHKTIFLSFHLFSPFSTHMYTYIRRYDEVSMATFRDALFGEDWAPVYLETDTDSAYEAFLRIFIYYFDAHFPLKRKIIKAGQSSSKSWITSEIRESSVRLRDLFRLKCKYPILGEQYKSEKRKHSNLVLQSKKAIIVLRYLTLIMLLRVLGK